MFSLSSLTTSFFFIKRHQNSYQKWPKIDGRAWHELVRPTLPILIIALFCCFELRINRLWQIASVVGIRSNQQNLDLHCSYAPCLKVDYGWCLLLDFTCMPCRGILISMQDDALMSRRGKYYQSLRIHNTHLPATNQQINWHKAKIRFTELSPRIGQESNRQKHA